MQIEIRPANLLDCNEVFHWRNDPLSISMSFTSTKISFDDHAKWFEASLRDTDREIYIGFLRDIKIGVCRFDYNSDNQHSYVSININPSQRGLGYGRRLLSQCIHRYRDVRESDLIAEVSPKNVASLELFKGAGFNTLAVNRQVCTLLKPYKKNSYREISLSDADLLYDLLQKRKFSISHDRMPTKEEHYKFMKTKPYRHWSLVFNNNEPVGTFYLQNNNSIGINILEPSFAVLSEVCCHIHANFRPLDAVKSQVPPYFYVNVAHLDIETARLMVDIGAIPIQTTYRI